MRYHPEIIKDIGEFLSANKLSEELTDFQNEIQAGTTGSELCLRVGSWLKSNKTDGLKELADEFILYCHANGLYPKKRSLS